MTTPADVAQGPEHRTPGNADRQSTNSTTTLERSVDNGNREL